MINKPFGGKECSVLEFAEACFLRAVGNLGEWTRDNSEKGMTNSEYADVLLQIGKIQLMAREWIKKQRTEAGQ